ncbi:DUF6264 family protein [Microbacterium sp. NPDC058342]|uniref:DUF6264 family protein n=1 Tax=Microbacterium sp. NPDC058342 TaxID=3346454 RepID=UPI00365BEAB0
MSVDRPQYGEYASPEEQRIRAGLPPLGQEVPSTDALGPVAPLPPATRSAAHPADRLMTAVLLGFGLVNVLSSIPGLLDLSSTLQETLRLMGLEGEFSNFAAAKAWGVVALVALLGGYAATLWLSVRRIRGGRSSWWVPLVGFVVTMLVVSICVSVPMVGDPAFMQGLATPPAG